MRLPDTLKGLLRCEMAEAIEQANLGNDDTQIAAHYLIEQIPQIEIAAELGCERSTISRRLRGILLRIEHTARKMKYIT